MQIVILGLSITSSWGNGHATTYRSLVRELVRRGHDVLFLERDVPWYANNRDLLRPPFGRTALYYDFDDLVARFEREVDHADLVMVGSYVPEGVRVSEWVLATAKRATAFYDIDTPITLAKLERGDYEYLAPELIPRYQLYLSFTGGPTLDRIAKNFGASMVRPLYCSVDPALYFPESIPKSWQLGYLGTYSADRQRYLECLMLEPARRRPESRFVVAGPLYPDSVSWPGNLERIEHLPPARHREFYNAQFATLNLTRSDMVRAGYSPSVRLFEAAACGTPIITDEWQGLEEFFCPGQEILVARCPEDVLRYLYGMPPEELAAVGRRGRQRIMAEHSAGCRAAELEDYVEAILPMHAGM